MAFILYIYFAIVFDSFGKMRPGFLTGEYTDFGKWDQCLNVDDRLGDQKLFQGKFCVYELKWPLPKTKSHEESLRRTYSREWIHTLIKDSDSFRFQAVSNSICVPSVCGRHELQNAIQFCEYSTPSCDFISVWYAASLSILVEQ